MGNNQTPMAVATVAAPAISRPPTKKALNAAVTAMKDSGFKIPNGVQMVISFAPSATGVAQQQQKSTPKSTPRKNNNNNNNNNNKKGGGGGRGGGRGRGG